MNMLRKLSFQILLATIFGLLLSLASVTITRVISPERASSCKGIQLDGYTCDDVPPYKATRGFPLGYKTVTDEQQVIDYNTLAYKETTSEFKFILNTAILVFITWLLIRVFVISKK